ncbi:MAG: PSD1 and planctomycete cytochrome C domain-containing protein [Akkermansiaceae bacterium]
MALPCVAEEKISFNQQIRPILNSSCTKCHGGAIAEGNLSLVDRAQALGKGKSGKIAIVPGKPEQSEVYRRIITDDIDDKMPLQTGPHAEEPLTSEQAELIRKWIEQGAKWEKHWAYIAPEKPAAPELKNPSWVKQPMDQFVLTNLEKNALQPTSEASREQWLRRASLDLTGLPPTLAELESFQQNTSSDAYEKEVARLLASPHFGERWAAVWMDLARYADSMGYEKDPHRNIWPYRDYLITAFNKDKPYDQFLREQLAGDLFPNATSESIVASAFHRNTQTNTEGGTDDEEFRIMSTIDRINTTWTAAQGLTFGCVQCHSHPYEPIPHGDYYRFMSFFNSTEDADVSNDYPHFKVASDVSQLSKSVSLYQEIPKLRAAINAPGKERMLEADSWEPLKYSELKSTHGKLQSYPTGEIHTSGTLAVRTQFDLTAVAQDFTAMKITIIPEKDNPAELPVRGSVLSQLTLQKVKADGTKEEIPLAYVFADSLAGPHDPVDTIKKGRTGFGAFPKLFRSRTAVIVPKNPVVFAGNEKLHINIKHAASTTGSQACTLRKFKIETDNDTAWIEHINSDAHKQAVAKHEKAQSDYNAISGTTIPVMQERPKEAARETRLFIGGLWLNKGEIYTQGVPELLNGYQEKVENRLQMAQWISSPKNPLTARVMANRVFAELFGRGIVETLGDFGTTGTKPTNQELLDHLAVAFHSEHQWSLKSLLREMVLSATYRQDYKASPELAKMDPLNHLLARGPRNRLTSEMVRDNALLVSGLLTRKMGGKSVMPPQPDGIWQTVYNGGQWKTAKGPERYRRAVYTYWKRTSPYPSMITFDTPSRELCSAQRISTNTPLHALITLNDPVFLECSQALAKRMSSEGGNDLNKQIAHGYLLATQHQANEKITSVLADLYQKLLKDYQNDPALAKPIGATPEDAAMTVLANTILNLDNALTK